MNFSSHANPDQKQPKLLDQVRSAIRLRHYSIRTEEAYIQWIRRYILFHNKRHPREMGSLEINRFLSHLASGKRVASSTQNQALCALVFLYKVVLHKDPGELGDVVWAKKPKKLPVVLTRQEVKVLLSGLEDEKQIMGNLLYGAGLRLMECIRLRVKDLDFGYRQILVRDGKGEKDRITMLPACVIQSLQSILCKCVRSIDRIWGEALETYTFLMRWIESTLSRTGTQRRHHTDETNGDRRISSGILSWPSKKRPETKGPAVCPRSLVRYLRISSWNNRRKSRISLSEVPSSPEA